MTDATGFERISQIQDEILGFTWEQVASKVDKFYVQGKITDDDTGRVTSVQGNVIFAISGNSVLNNSQLVSDEEFDENSDFVCARIREMHDLLYELQGKSPVRFRWSVDTTTRQVESDWTYYDDLTAQEKQDDFWKYWEGDFAWEEQLTAELANQPSTPTRRPSALTRLIRRVTGHPNPSNPET